MYIIYIVSRYLYEVAPKTAEEFTKNVSVEKTNVVQLKNVVEYFKISRKQEEKAQDGLTSRVTGWRNRSIGRRAYSEEENEIIFKYIDESESNGIKVKLTKLSEELERSKSSVCNQLYILRQLPRNYEHKNFGTNECPNIFVY